MAAMMAVAALTASAQNIQIHYDFGRPLYSAEESSRQNITITYEGFKADGIGSWYYFIDADIDREGVLGAYTELSREFNIGKKGFAAHVEYDGGLNRGGSFQSAGLAGIAWNGHNEDFSTTYSVQLMYKQFFGQRASKLGVGARGYASAQLTGVWSTRFANDKLTFAGFIDFWRGQRWDNNHGCLVVLTEPQLWYNVSKHVSFGTEVEVSSNFINCIKDNKTFFINPTLAFKYNF